MGDKRQQCHFCDWSTDHWGAFVKHNSKHLIEKERPDNRSRFEPSQEEVDAAIASIATAIPNK